eukprot:scaffold6508_cov37-Tisochrysis_lutea.AAC.4
MLLTLWLRLVTCDALALTVTRPDASDLSCGWSAMSWGWTEWHVLFTIVCMRRGHCTLYPAMALPLQMFAPSSRLGGCHMRGIPSTLKWTGVHGCQRGSQRLP